MAGGIGFEYDVGKGLVGSVLTSSLQDPTCKSHQHSTFENSFWHSTFENSVESHAKGFNKMEAHGFFC